LPLDARAGTFNLMRPGTRAASRDVVKWMAAAMADRAPAEIAQVSEGWTPQRAGKALVEALRWARYAAGQVGPRGMVSASLPKTALSDDDFAEMGWGIRESADDPADAPPLRVQLSARQVSRHEATLTWPTIYLVATGREGSARMVGLWAACKAYRRSFAGAVKARGIERSAAYALRDRGLSLISQGLAKDRVPVDL